MDKHGTWAAAGGVALGLAALGRRSPGQPFATATAAAAGGLYLVGTFAPRARIFGTTATLPESTRASCPDVRRRAGPAVHPGHQRAARPTRVPRDVLRPRPGGSGPSRGRGRGARRRARARMPRGRPLTARVRVAERGPPTDRSDRERCARGDRRSSCAVVPASARRSQPLADPSRRCGAATGCVPGTERCSTRPNRASRPSRPGSDPCSPRERSCCSTTATAPDARRRGNRRSTPCRRFSTPPKPGVSPRSARRPACERPRSLRGNPPEEPVSSTFKQSSAARWLIPLSLLMTFVAVAVVASNPSFFGKFVRARGDGDTSQEPRPGSAASTRSATSS